MIMAARRLGLQNLPLRQLQSRKAVSVYTDTSTTRFLSTRRIRITNAGTNDLNDVFTRIEFPQNSRPRLPQAGVHEELDEIIERHGLERTQVQRQFNKWMYEETFLRSARDQRRICLQVSAQQRFYQALLRTSPTEFLKSHSSKLHRNQIMGEIWGRAHFGEEIKETILSLPKKNQLPWPDHLARLAFLVLEESRQIIADELDSIFGDKRTAPLNTKATSVNVTVCQMKQPILVNKKRLDSIFGDKRTAPLNTKATSVNVTVCQMKQPILGNKKRRPLRRRPNEVLIRLETDLDHVDDDILRPGTLVGVQPTYFFNDKDSIDNMVWGILGRDPRRSVENRITNFPEETSRWSAETGHRILEMVLPVSKTMFPEGTSLRIYGITSLISQTRQFEACQHGMSLPFYLDLDHSANDDWHRDPHKPSSRQPAQAPNGPALVRPDVLNKKKGYYQPDDDNGEESELSLSVVKQEKNRTEDLAFIALSKEFEQAEREFVIPPLNGSQEDATSNFLNSAEGSSITLVQGPPGTGKTTLLTAAICRFLLDSTRKLVHPDPDGEEDMINEINLPRLLVCANSNKAVTVLASRYLRAAQGNTLFHAVVIGDEGKLLNDDQPALRSIYLFTWMDVVIEEWKAIQRLLQDDAKETDELLLRATALVDKLHAQIPQICERKEVTPLLNVAVEALEELGSCKVSDGDMKEAKAHAKMSISKLIEKLKYLTCEEQQVAKELVSTAHVIFSTLTSAGATFVKKGIANIGAIIIDEAAAATEPQLYIPLVHMEPKRLMVVGDPNQLPATVMSRVAERHGLNKSLHERLMFDCNRPYTMLNEQYRMKPEISRFPSAAFYDNNIADGPNVKRLSYKSPATLMDGQPYAFIHVDGEEKKHDSGSQMNLEEAKKVVELLLELRHVAGKTGVNNEWSSVDRVRVITFYQAQVSLISKMLQKNGLKNIVVSTVDSSQGSESDVIIISFVRTGKQASVGFLKDNRRLNVALTRAKHQLIVIGNVNTLARVSGAAKIRALLEDARERGFISGN